MQADLCARPGCNGPTKPHHLACRDCWRQLPDDLRRELTDAFLHGPVIHYRSCLVRALRTWELIDDQSEVVTR